MLMLKLGDPDRLELEMELVLADPVMLTLGRRVDVPEGLCDSVSLVLWDTAVVGDMLVLMLVL